MAVCFFHYLTYFIILKCSKVDPTWTVNLISLKNNAATELKLKYVEILYSACVCPALLLTDATNVQACESLHAKPLTFLNLPHTFWGLVHWQNISSKFSLDFHLMCHRMDKYRLSCGMHWFHNNRWTQCAEKKNPESVTSKGVTRPE